MQSVINIFLNAISFSVILDYLNFATVFKNSSAMIMLGLRFLPLSRNGTAQIITTYHSYPTTGHVGVITTPVT
jgi:hypothetical protein